MNPRDQYPEIPYGPYCYTTLGINGDYSLRISTCPYWSIREGREEQENGYCKLLGLGDWMEHGTSLLWDQVKECGINDD